MEPSEDGGLGHAPGQGGIPLSGVSLRTTKPTWSKKTNSMSVSRLNGQLINLCQLFNHRARLGQQMAQN